MNIKDWAFSKKNVYACAVASVGVGLFLLGVIDKFWWIITLGLYLATYFYVEPDVNITLKSDNKDYFLKSHTTLSELMQSSHNALPPDIQAVLLKLQTNLTDLHGFFQKSDALLVVPTEELYSIKIIFESYLPSMIAQYNKLPVSYATKVQVKDGKTTKDYLLAQVSLLDSQFEKMTHAIYGNDAKSLVANGEYLKSKFASHEEWAELLSLPQSMSASK